MKIATQVYDDRVRDVILDHAPDRCPICNYAINPIFQLAYLVKSNWDIGTCLQVIFKCTRLPCQCLFISYYQAISSAYEKFYFVNSAPTNKREQSFDKTVKNISEAFCTIYNQAFAAEQYGLLEICGVGYRKSFEFLIKDYLVKCHPDKEQEIKGKFLGNCISEYVEDIRIKKIAKRAAWLGNDETHYLRKWEGRDLQDLKQLIDIALHWIQMEQLTKDAISNMPED